MSYIVVFRNPTGRGLLVMQDDDDSIVEFESIRDADTILREHPLANAWGYDLLEVSI